MFIFGKRSRERLVGVHPDLIIVMSFAIYETDLDFAVIEGMRTLERQKETGQAGCFKNIEVPTPDGSCRGHSAVY